MELKMTDVALEFASIPEERKHALILKLSGGLVLEKAVEGYEDFLPCIAIKAVMKPWRQIASDEGEEHLFIIDLRQAIQLKRTIERTLAHFEASNKG